MPETVHIYIETDSTSPRTMSRNYGYVLECVHLGKPKTRAGFGRTEGSWNKAVLQALLEALGRLNRPCEVHIHAMNEYVLCMLEKNLEHWAAMGFIGSKGKPVANREEWEKLWQLGQEHLLLTEPAGPGRHEYSRWLLDEMGRRSCESGNEIPGK